MAEVLEVGGAFLIGVIGGILGGVLLTSFFVGANNSRYVRIEDEEDD